MSSHHIVRDEQEPALLLWQSGQVSFEQAGQLLEWSPRVVVHQQALDEALVWGIKLDAVCTAPDALAETEAAVEHQQPVSLLPLSEQDPLQAILFWLKGKQQSSLYLIADAAANNFMLLQQLEPLQQLAQIQVLSQGWRYSYYKLGQAQKWLPAGSRLRLVSFNKLPLVNAGAAATIMQHLIMQELVLEQSGMVRFGNGSSAEATPFWLGEAL